MQKMNRFDRMKILCLFDLSMETNAEKREYRIFRKTLLENGFIMLQYSVYVRTCPNREFSKKFVNKLKVSVPKNGNIRLLSITEKQYDDMEFILGNKTCIERVVAENRIIVI